MVTAQQQDEYDIFQLKPKDTYPSIMIGDLCYFYDWDYSRPVPLGPGYIAAYLKKHLPDIPIQIFKDPRKLIDRLNQDLPDILALSHYDWNANLDLAVLRYAKRLSADMLTVLGGPNFEAQDLAWIKNFFEERPEVDLYITGEGEWSFNRLVHLLISYGGRIENIPFSVLPSSFYYFDRKAKRVINNPSNPVARLDLSTVPSPYLAGLMDPFLEDERLAPIFETNRGCPYSCTFCGWGQATRSKVNQLSLETVFDEIRYATGRTKNPTGFMYIADGNFGILKRDLKIAEVIQECTKLHDRPKRLYIYFAKNTNDRIIEIAEKLSAVTSMSMAKQTLNPEVLKRIKRANIPVSQYDRLRTECEKRNIATFCELIYGLPGETYQSFVDGVIASVRGGQTVTLYPHIMIHGAESSSKAYREKYGIKTAFRIIPRSVSAYPDIPSLEYEEVVIQTDTMSAADYFRIRMFQFLSFVLGRDMFTEFAYGLRCRGLDYATIADIIAKDEENWTTHWREILSEHRWVTQNELIPLDKVKVAFTSEDLTMINKDLGLPKLLSSSEKVQDLRDYLCSLLPRRFGAQMTDEEMEELIVTLDLSVDRIVCFDNPLPEKNVEYGYDVDAWLTNGNLSPLNEFRCDKPIPYLLKMDDDIMPVIEQSYKVIGDMAETLYRVRYSNVSGGYGDRIYTYKRIPLRELNKWTHTLAAAQRRRREQHERHSQTASR